MFNDTNIQPYFEFANFFKDILKIFSKVLKIKEKKTAANSTYAPLKRAHSRKTLSENIYTDYDATNYILVVGMLRHSTHVKDSIYLLIRLIVAYLLDAIMLQYFTNE